MSETPEHKKPSKSYPSLDDLTHGVVRGEFDASVEEETVAYLNSKAANRSEDERIETQLRGLGFQMEATVRDVYPDPKPFAYFIERAFEIRGLSVSDQVLEGISPEQLNGIASLGVSLTKVQADALYKRFGIAAELWMELHAYFRDRIE